MNNGACNFNRHELVWLKLDAVKHAQYAGPTPMEPVAALSLLHRWVLGNYPLIVARQTDVPEGLLRIGLAEPASWGKRRLSFLVNTTHIAQHQQGPQLAEVIAKLLARPPATRSNALFTELSSEFAAAWQPGAAALLNILNELNIPAQVYGSAAIEALTGLPCLTANSDIDVLFKPADWASVQALCSHLQQLQTAHPQFKVDGEVLSPSGLAVHWKEILHQPGKVLAKCNNAVHLIELDQYKQAFSNPVRRQA
ncbi:MAG: malonate decarboxylase holo-[acyl-carrier-protein] synthase [Limnobacter sp.]|uniref:malonate decarboxylase holo-[acyl-carrier-protein] synthase n=1 Tax=Limnobacter sp. TaxID=2003368 RepID=UPI0022BD861E|nr:malonate decarboxylase holo-[acyl-carrier-protein] synthase [Limnobacter sp.]MCZ8016163.1 malonate decarboxylase holo-[acyl-carrier-protein] synthase [Limnobacter sp.]